MLYDEHDVGEFIEGFRNEIASEYDYILIDSRTGITDIGDVCTVLLPDVLVTLFITNTQNVEGTIQMVERARQARSRLPVDRSKLLVLPLPSRDESDSEYALAEEWRSTFATEFRRLLKDWLPRNVPAEDYFDRVYLPYFPVWSFGERLPVIESPRELKDPKTLGVAYQNVCRLLVNRLDWLALSDERNIGEVTAVRTELRAAEEQYQFDRKEFETEKSRLASRSRRNAIVGAVGSLAAAGAGWFVYQAFVPSGPELVFATKSRIETGLELTAAAMSPDGVWVIGGAQDGQLEAIETQTGARLAVPLSGHSGKITSIAFKKDGSSFASGSDDGVIRTWDTDGFRDRGWEFVLPTSSSTWAVALSPDGRRIVSGSADETLRLWDAETGAAIGGPLEGHGLRVTSVAFSSDGRRIVSGSADTTLRLWDAETRAAIGGPLEGHKDWVTSVAFSPDGRRIVSGSDDETLRLWDAETEAAIGAPLEGHGGSVHSVAFSPDGRRIVSGSDDGTLRLWDAETGAAIGAPLEGHGGGVYSVAFSPDGRRIVSGSYDETLRLWDAETGAAIGAPLEGHGGGVDSVAFSPDGRRIVSGSDDRTLRLWDAETGAAIGAPLEGHGGGVYSVAFSPDGRRIVSGSYDETLRLWDVETGAVARRAFAVAEGAITGLSYAASGRALASSITAGGIEFWDPDGRNLNFDFPIADQPEATSVSFSQDSSQLLVGALNGTIHVASATSGFQRAPLAEQSGAITFAEYSPDGLRIASGSEDRSVRLWNTAAQGEFQRITFGEQIAPKVGVFSNDGARLAVGTSVGSVAIIDVIEAQILATLQPEVSNVSGEIVALAFSGDGTTLTLVSSGGVIFSADLVVLQTGLF